MSALFALLGPKLIGVMAVVIGAIGLAFQQRLAGAKAERNKLAAKEADAYEKHLEDLSKAASAGNAVRPSDSLHDDPFNRDR